MSNNNNMPNNNNFDSFKNKIDTSKLKTKPCKYYHTPTGCTRDESKCFFIHDPMGFNKTHASSFLFL